MSNTTTTSKARKARAPRTNGVQNVTELATTAPASAPKTAPVERKYQQAQKTADGLDLTALLLAGLKAQGVKAEIKVAPAGHYFRVLVDKKAVAYVNYRNGGALRVEPKLEGKELPKTVKGFTPAKNVRQGLGYVGTFSTEAELAHAITAITLAAQKLEA